MVDLVCKREVVDDMEYGGSEKQCDEDLNCQVKITFCDTTGHIRGGATGEPMLVRAVRADWRMDVKGRWVVQSQAYLTSGIMLIMGKQGREEREYKYNI